MVETTPPSSTATNLNPTGKSQVNKNWMITTIILALILFFIIIGKNQSQQTKALVIIALILIAAYFIVIEYLNQAKKLDIYKMIQLIQKKEAKNKNYLNTRPNNVWVTPLAQNRFMVHFFEELTTFELNKGDIVARTYHDMDWYRGIINRDLASQSLLHKGINNLTEAKQYEL